MEKTVVGEHIVYRLYDDIEDFSAYNDFFETMEYLRETDLVTIKINSGGGRIDVGMMIVQAIQNCKAYVTCDVVYPSYSMASVIALSGDKLIMRNNSLLMFHNYSTRTFGKGGELVQNVLETDKYINAMFLDTCSPFLTEKEFARLRKDEDIYIAYDDKTLKQRIKRHFGESND